MIDKLDQIIAGLLPYIPLAVAWILFKIFVVPGLLQ